MEEKHFIKREDVVLRTVHGSVFLIDIRDNYAGDTCSIFEINETGEFIWNCLNEKMAVTEMAEKLKRELSDDVPETVLLSDIQEYLNDLQMNGFVCEVSKNG